MAACSCCGDVGAYSLQAPPPPLPAAQDGYHPTVKLHQAMLASMFTGIYLAQRDTWYRWEGGSGDGLSEADFKPRQRHFFILPPKDAAEAARRENEAAAAEALARRIRRRQRLFATPSPKSPPKKPLQPPPKKPAAGGREEEQADEDEAPLVQLNSTVSQKKQARDAAVQAAVASLVPRFKDSDKQHQRHGGKWRRGNGTTATPAPSLAEGARARGAKGGNGSGGGGGGDDDEAAAGGGDDDAASPLDDGEGKFKFGLLGASVRAIRDQLVPRLRLANESVSSALAQSSYLVLLSLALPLVIVVAWAGRRSRTFPTLVVGALPATFPLVGAAGARSLWGARPAAGGPAAAPLSSAGAGPR